MRANRTAHIANRAASSPAEDGLVEIAISSEAPYERWFGIEVLRHTADAVDMSRIADGRHPVLVNHSTDDQVGVLKSATLNEDRVLRGMVKFSRSARGQEIKMDVEDDIRTLVSVGYFIDEIEEVERAADGTETLVRRYSGEEFEREMRTLHGDDFYRSGLAAARAKGDTPPTFVVTRWTPFEASIVPVPADVSVGKGRSAGVEPSPQTAALAAPQAPAHQPLIIVENRKMDITQKTPADLEIERRDAIAALGEQYAKYLKPNDIKDAVQSKLSRDAFIEVIMARMESKHSDTSGVHIGMSGGEVKRYSLARAITAQLTGSWEKAGFERECSQAVARALGQDPEGFFLPPDVFRRDFNVGTASEAGNLVATGFRGDLFTDVLRNNMVMGQLGATFLTGLSSNVDIPRKITASTLGMLTEIGSASESQPATAKATLSPKRISAYVEASKQALIQSGVSLEAMIRDDLVSGAAVLLENQGINGAGTGAEIRGLRNVTGIGTVVGGANGLAPAWSHLVDLESACANANAEPDRLSGYLTNTRVRGRLKQTQFATNLPFIWQNGDMPVNGYRAAVTNNVPSNLTKGTSTTICSATLFGSDWSNVVIGLFGAPDITVDPYTKADTGQVKITINQFADLAHRQPATTSKIDDLLA